MSRCIPLRLLIVCLFVVLVICPSAQSQEPTLDRLVDDIAQQFKRTEKKHFLAQVLVIDFASRSGRIKVVGEYLADQLSDSLRQRIGIAAVVDRKKLQSYLLTGGISPLDLADRGVSMWIASQLGASAIVFGSVAPSNERLLLSTDTYTIKDNKHLGSAKADLILNDQLKEILTKPLDWPGSADVLVACTASKSKENAGDLFKAAGITMPTCVHCPNPDYTDEARAANIQGSVRFDVVVDELGKAKHIAVIQGDQYGLTARALEAIKNWRFKPAMKDGQPVTVCVDIEVVFRRY